MTAQSVTRQETDLARQKYGSVTGNRWVQLIAGVVAMIVISNYQDALTLFTPGMKLQFADVPYSKIALVFSLFILFETWPMPVSGYFVDNLGIRKLMIIGSLAVGAGWLLCGTVARSVSHLYIYYGVIAGTGAGIIYISCVANAVKWFPDRRGLAAGLTSAGFGGGAALTIMPIAGTINSIGWGPTMAVWGVIQGVIAFAAALILRHPPSGWVPAGWDGRPAKPAKAVVQSKANYTWSETLKRPEFYLLYVMFVLACTGGLMATGNLSQIGKVLKVADAKVWGFAIIPLAATLTSAANAFSRILWGWASDRMGRDYTMALAFFVEAIIIYLVTRIVGSPVAFVLVFTLVFLFWGEIYSLFSAVTGDIFGPKNASVNYGMVYSAKGLASILAGYGAALLAALFAGSFDVPFYIASVCCFVSAALAYFALRPLIRGRIGVELAPAGSAA